MVKSVVVGKKVDSFIPFIVLVLSMLSLLVFFERSRELPLKPGEYRYKERPSLRYLAPNFSLPDLKGQMIELKNYRGKVVFINFWATWCLTCEEEMPSMERLYQMFKGKPFEMLTISIDKEGENAINDYLEKFGLTFPVLLDPKSNVAELYRTTGVPETFIIDKNGFIYHKSVGPRKWDTAESIESFNNLVNL